MCAESGGGGSRTCTRRSRGASATLAPVNCMLMCSDVLLPDDVVVPHLTGKQYEQLRELHNPLATQLLAQRLVRAHEEPLRPQVMTQQWPDCGTDGWAMVESMRNAAVEKLITLYSLLGFRV